LILRLATKLDNRNGSRQPEVEEHTLKRHRARGSLAYNNTLAPALATELVGSYSVQIRSAG
jgi:hypothetical protein